MDPPTTVKDDCKVSDAISLMRIKGFDQLPVVPSDESNVLHGMVTVDDLMAGISGGTVKANTPVIELLSKKYQKMDLSATIGDLSQMLKSTHFVVITEDDPDFDRILGILTHIDIINYVIKMEEDEA